MASRRMRIKTVANIPSLNKRRPGQPGNDPERPSTPKSPASPFTFDRIPSIPPKPRTISTTSEEGNPPSPRKEDFCGSPGKSRSMSPTKPSQHSRPESRASEIRKSADFDDVPMVQLNSPSPTASLRPSPSTSPNKSFSSSSPRPGPSHSPFKTVVMLTSHGPQRRSPVHFRSPTKNQPSNTFPSYPLSPNSHHSYSQLYGRKSPSPLHSPKSPGMIDFSHGSGVRRPSSPLRSPSQYTRDNNVFSPPPSNPNILAIQASPNRDHNFSVSNEPSNRASSPMSNTCFGTTSNAITKESFANTNNSCETLRQRLQKGTNLNTSKYAASRKEFLIKYTDKQPEASELKMLHFTFWNPPTERRAKESDEVGVGEEDFFGDTSEHGFGSSERLGDTEPSRKLMEIRKKESIAAQSQSHPVPDANTANDTVSSVGPRVKVGPNGEITVDEQSLVVETSEAQRAKKHLEEMETVAGTGNDGFYRHKRNPRRGGDWTQRDTVKFYRALSMCGTDFSMMTHLFPMRSRAELKAKFKREDRKNPAQISQALACQSFDPMNKMTSSEEDPDDDDDEPDFCIPPPAPKKHRKRSLNIGKRKNRNKKTRALFVSDSEHPDPLRVGSTTESRLELENLGNRKPTTGAPQRKRRKSVETSVDNTITRHSISYADQMNLKEPSRDQKPSSFKDGRSELIKPDSMDPKKPMYGKFVPKERENPEILLNDPEWVSPLQPEYGNTRLKPKLKPGRPRRVFDKNVERLPKSEQIFDKKFDVNSGSTKKQRVKQSKPSSLLPISKSVKVESELIKDTSDQISIQSEMLRFDPSDPLGLMINVSQNVESSELEVVLDAPNCGTIHHQIFEIESIEDIASSTLPSAGEASETHINATKCDTKIPFVDTAHKRCAKLKAIPRVPRYRVPGPGGKANRSSRVVDEIEIEITCL